MNYNNNLIHNDKKHSPPYSLYPGYTVVCVCVVFN